MDPVTAAVVASLSAGATFVGKEVASEAVKDAYARLKAWIRDHYPDAGVDRLEQQPASTPLREAAAEDLERDGASGDRELVQLARALAIQLKSGDAGVARSIGVDLGELDTVTAAFGDVDASGGTTAVRIAKATHSALSFGNVTTSGGDDRPKKP